jgi:hypothetical protein
MPDDGFIVLVVLEGVVGPIYGTTGPFTLCNPTNVRYENSFRTLGPSIMMGVGQFISGFPTSIRVRYVGVSQEKQKTESASEMFPLSRCIEVL